MKSKDLKPITIHTIIQSDINKVWEYWTNPEHITQWNFATEEWCYPHAENDLRPSGKFSWRMEAKDGSMGFDFTGVYEKISEKELITYIMADGREVRIEFLESGNEITLRETFDAEGSNSDEQQRAGWQAILGNFKKYVETDD